MLNFLVVSAATDRYSVSERGRKKKKKSMVSMRE